MEAISKKIVIYSANVSEKRSKILEKSGKNQGIPCGKKCGYPADVETLVKMQLPKVVTVRES